MSARAVPGLVAALLGACAERVPLSQVPVRGGTDAQQAEVRRIIEGFEQAAGPGRVALTEVVFSDIYGPAIGTFSPVSFRVRLESGLQGFELERVLRHELCHALDYTEGLVAEPDPAFDALVHDLFVLGAVDTEGLEGPRNRRSEAFARFCEKGPLIAEALSSACPGEPDEVTEVAATLVRQVWPAWERPQSSPIPGRVHASWTAPAPDPEEFGVIGLADPSQIRVQYGSARVDLDLESGRPPDRGASPPFAPQEELPEGLDGLCPMYGYLSDGAGWAEGPAAALVRFDLYEGSAVARVLAADGGAWGPVHGCVSHQHTDLFATADHRLWLAWVDGATVSWVPLLE
jgi:hypothetical protein